MYFARAFSALLVGLVLTPASVTAPAAAAAAAPRRDILRTEKKIYTRGNEEVIIRDFFQDRRGGVFLDVGCWHPVTASNTYYLEKNLGWSGVAVDALAELERKWKRERPASRFRNYIVTDEDGATRPFFRVELTDISSLEKPEVGPGGKKVKSHEVMVPTITLNRLLADLKVDHVDFVSMDIEGSELPALRGFDIERYRPQLLCIESKPKNRDALLAYFKSHRYHRIEEYLKHDQTNWYFTPDSPKSKP